MKSRDLLSVRRHIPIAAQEATASDRLTQLLLGQSSPGPAESDNALEIGAKGGQERGLCSHQVTLAILGQRVRLVKAT